MELSFNKWALALAGLAVAAAATPVDAPAAPAPPPKYQCEILTKPKPVYDDDGETVLSYNAALKCTCGTTVTVTDPEFGWPVSEGDLLGLYNAKQLITGDLAKAICTCLAAGCILEQESGPGAE